MIYVIPWDQTVLIGTTDTFYSGDKETLPVTAEATDYLLAGVNRYFPRAALTPGDVLSSFVGARPLLGGEAGESEESASRDYEVVSSGPRMWSITGGKLTTYRAMAERMVDQVVRKDFYGRKLGPCLTKRPLACAEHPLPLDAATPLRELWQRYGSDALAIESMIRDAPELGQRIDDRAPYLWAEVVFAIENEYVEQIDDLVERRFGAFLLAPDIRLQETIECWLRDRRQTVPPSWGLAEARP
jgi:glycerol-3-phosphate dehydrogenase